jgi:hypothetical protein
MASSPISDLGHQLADFAGAHKPDVIAAADALAVAPNLAAWNTAWNGGPSSWVNVRPDVDLRAYLTAGLPDLPGLALLVARVTWADPAELAEGLHGPIELGPISLTLASGALIGPPAALGSAEAEVVGPFAPQRIAASLRPPFSGDDGGAPGGGTLILLPQNAGFGGMLQLPLGPAEVDATAILERADGGAVTFLAVMGVVFTPPIQLSFGFSLDRVGGIVGVNRTIDTTALADAVRTGKAGDALFATRPPASPDALVDELRRYFPDQPGHYVIGPTARLSWLSFGEAGSFVSLDLGVAVELPSAIVAIVGVGQAQIPSLPEILHLRADLLGVVDPHDQTISIDVSLVDSHALGAFALQGDGAARLNWGSQGYLVVSAGGFYPGFDPSPARIPPLRRLALGPDTPFPSGLTISAEGYFAFTTNTIQLGGRLDVTVGAGIDAHGFIQVDALVQFRPFFFTADISAGFDVEAFGHTFGGVGFEGSISGPHPVTIAGQLTIKTFIHDISWDHTFTIGDGPPDTAASVALLKALEDEIVRPGNLRAQEDRDPNVILSPRAVDSPRIAVAPTGMLRWAQRRVPLGLHLDRVDGQPLLAPAGAVLTSPTTGAVEERFAPGTYCNLTQAEALNRPAFDVHDAGGVLVPPVPTPAPKQLDSRLVQVITILNHTRQNDRPGGVGIDISRIAGLVSAARRPPTLSDPTPQITTARERWTTVAGQTPAPVYVSATAAHQAARVNGGVAVAEPDAATPIDLSAL